MMSAMRNAFSSPARTHFLTVCGSTLKVFATYFDVQQGAEFDHSVSFCHKKSFAHGVFVP